MSLIVCTSKCLYEQDGYCDLARVASCGMPCTENPCIHFIPREATQQIARKNQINTAMLKG